MNAPKAGLEDQSALQRRGLLDAEQERRLERELGVSLVERVVHEAGHGFDALDAVQPGDAELLARVTDRVASRVDHTRKAPRRRFRTIWLAAALAGSAVTVAAAATIRSVVAPDVVAPARGGALVESEQRAAQAVRAVGRVSLPPLSATEFVPPPPTVSSTGPKRLGPEVADSAPSTSPTPAVETEPVTASTLFSRANASRRRGEVEAAVTAYHELQSRFPTSSEAALSHVSLGNLHLRRGASSAALEQFDAYLRKHPGGGLSEEALRGKAEALGRLGRGAEARSTWQELLSRFPESAYADLARSHLK